MIGRIIRWFLLLYDFDYDIFVRKGKEHYMVDHLSRIKNGELPKGVNDELLDATLFKLYFVLELYDGVVEYLMSGRKPLGM